MLRFESQPQLNNRLATQALTLPGGEVIDAGSFVTLGVGAANRYPAGVFTVRLVRQEIVRE